MAWRPLGRLGKKSVPPSQARATDAEALARIAASVACVIAPKSPDGRDYSVPDLVSHLVTELRQLRDQKRERNALEQEKATLEGTIQPSQAESQTQQAEWRNQEAQYRSEINGLRDTHERPRQGYEQVKKSEPHLATAHSQLQQRFQDLEKERTELKQAKVTLERKIQASQEESQTQRAEWRNQEVQYRSEINGLRDTHERLRQGYEQVKKSESHLATAHSQLQQRFQDLEKERTVLKQAKVTLEGTIQASQEESQTQEAKLRNQEVQYHSEISGLKGKQERLRQDYESYISKIRMQHANHETALEQSYKLEERRMREEHESAVRKLKDQVQGLHVHAENRENDFNLEKMQLEEAHRVKQDELKEHFKAHESQLKQAHKQQQERLQKDIQSRTKALIARENYSSITDGELKSMFSGLVREVDALARLKWTSNRSPWSDELLSQISDTTKRLQKHILKDTIWEILFEHVFCSPFRVFGKEGSVLESQWNKAFGKDPKTGNDHYTWPEPSFDAERWRYDTMRQGQEALKIDTSEYDPRNKLRKGFQSSMKIICEKLSGKFEMVSKIDEKTEQTMEEIAEKAAKICVAFGTQRCRIFVVTKDLKTTDEVKEGPDRQGKLVELLTQPELRRIGDGDGQSLDKEQTVAGCEGEIKKILY